MALSASLTLNSLRVRYAVLAAGALAIAAVIIGTLEMRGARAFPSFGLLLFACAAGLYGGRYGVGVGAVCALAVIWRELPFRPILEEMPGGGLWLALVAGLGVSIVWWLSRVKTTLLALESRVAESQGALVEQMAQRRRLEQELIEISEREQRHFGHELHDSLGQHLTGAAITAHMLAGKLGDRPEARDAERLVKLLDDGVELTRSLARGLYPVELESAGLMAALDEFARGTKTRTQTPCVFYCPSPVPVRDAAAAMHLYRIAQEATNNAIRHGHARLVSITLEMREDRVDLHIDDDGRGLPPADQRGSGGMGLRIMANRAQIIGATLTTARRAEGGTRVACSWPIRASLT